MKRCSWCAGDEVYQKYHDCEWGVPVYDDCKLFEFLILEGAQAGLSWITILKRREGYRRAFSNFDFEKVAKFSEEDIKRLIQDKKIIRNKLKVKSAINNAKKFIEVRKEFGSFSNYLWRFTKGKIIVGNGTLTKNELSDKISSDLKKRGFSFVGTTIIYAYLQAIGIIFDHEEGCFLKRKA